MPLRKIGEFDVDRVRTEGGVHEQTNKQTENPCIIVGYIHKYIHTYIRLLLISNRSDVDQYITIEELVPPHMVHTYVQPNLQ